jgi:hypothetical protein
MKVKLVLFQKNEHILLNDWLLYHSHIFGIESIHVINHKPDQKTFDILSKFKVSYNSFNGEFQNKKKEISRVLKNYKNEVDILIPIDCDEFLCYLSNEGECFPNKNKIINELISLPKKCRYKVHELRAYADEIKYKDPLIEITNFLHEPMYENSKTLFPAKYFVKTDQGNHNGEITVNKNWVSTNLCYMHFHIMGYKHFKTKMINGLKSYKSVTNKGGKHYEFFGGKIQSIKQEHAIKNKDAEYKKVWHEYIGTGYYRMQILRFSEKIKELRLKG